MQDLIFEKSAFGRAALQQLGAVGEGFRLLSAEWLGDTVLSARVMKVTGADFRAAKGGPNKGKLAIKLAGTTRTAYVTREEIAANRGVELKQKTDEREGMPT